MMADNPYKVVGAKLMELLREAARPDADFASIANRVRTVDYGMRFPDYLPVSNAKFAVEQCLGPRKVRNTGDAYMKISSCEHAAGQYFEQDGVTLRADYADLQDRLDGPFKPPTPNYR